MPLDRRLPPDLPAPVPCPEASPAALLLVAAYVVLCLLGLLLVGARW